MSSANRRAFSAVVVLRWTATVRATLFQTKKTVVGVLTFAQSCAICVCSAVRVVLFAESSALTSLKSRAYSSLLDPNLSEAYNALCLNKLNYEYDANGAETACRRAIELDPNSPLAHNTYARLLFSSQKKRFDEAFAEIKTAIDLDPTSFYHQIVYTVALTYARRYDEATQQLERLAQRNPKRAVSYFWLVGGVAFQGKQAEDFERLTRLQKLAETDEETVRLYKTAYQTDGW